MQRDTPRAVVEGLAAAPRAAACVRRETGISGFWI